MTMMVVVMVMPQVSKIQVMAMMVVVMIIHDGDVGDIPSDKGGDKKIEL